MSKVYGAINSITEKIGSLAKTGTNTSQNYAFAKWSDLAVKLQPLMVEEGLIFVPSETAQTVYDGPPDRDGKPGGRVLSITYEFTIAHKEGEVLPYKPKNTGMSALFSQKGSADDKAANKCLTAATKYFVLSLFKIPTVDADDADAGDHRSGEIEATGAFELRAEPVKPRPAATAPQSTAPQQRAPEQLAKREPLRSDAPMDATTGETSPHTIMLGVEGDKTNWVIWGPAFISAVGSCSKIEEIDAWVKANAATLKIAETTAAKFYARLRDITQTARNKLKAEAPAADPLNGIPPGMDRRPADEGFIEGVEAEFAACEDVAGLDAVWASHETATDMKGRATRDRIAESYEHHVRRTKNVA